MGQSLPKPALRPMLPADAAFVAAIFSASIEDLTVEDYGEAQRAAWASAADDAGEFAARLAGQLVLVATVADAPVAFISLKGPDHIDMLYVHPGVARQGIATLLYDAIERLATARGATQLMVDASDTAVPFFERRGFEAQQRNMVMLGGEWLGNTRMKKRVTKAEPRSASQ
jgi:putative acetyltransferase